MERYRCAGLCKSVKARPLVKEIKRHKSIFIDTAPFIYFIEANPKFGPLVKEVINVLNQGKLVAYTSVLTLTEVLPKPIQMKRNDLVNEFINFFRSGKNLCLVEISETIAEMAG